MIFSLLFLFLFKSSNYSMEATPVTALLSLRYPDISGHYI